jgi:hypothetical protein
VESKRASRKEMLSQKTQPAIYGIEKENFKTLLTLTKKENSLFSGAGIPWKSLPAGLRKSDT